MHFPTSCWDFRPLVAKKGNVVDRQKQYQAPRSVTHVTLISISFLLTGCQVIAAMTHLPINSFEHKEGSARESVCEAGVA